MALWNIFRKSEKGKKYDVKVDLKRENVQRPQSKHEAKVIIKGWKKDTYNDKSLDNPSCTDYWYARKADK